MAAGTGLLQSSYIAATRPESRLESTRIRLRGREPTRGDRSGRRRLFESVSRRDERRTVGFQAHCRMSREQQTFWTISGAEKRGSLVYLAHLNAVDNRRGLFKESVETSNQAIELEREYN